MPLLRLQEGFRDGVTTIAPERSVATEDTLWNTREDAEAYERAGYLEVIESLSACLESRPVTSIFESPKIMEIKNLFQPSKKSNYRDAQVNNKK